MKRIFILAVLSPLLSPPAAAGDDGPEALLRKYESVMDSYFRGNPRKKPVDAHDRKLAEYNAHVEAFTEYQKTEGAGIERQIQAIRGMNVLAARLNKEVAKKPDASDQGAVNAYNEKVAGHNDLVDRITRETEAHNKAVEAYNAEVRRRGNELDREKAALEADQVNLDSRVKAIDEWFEKKKDREFFRELCSLFARLAVKKRQSGLSGAEEKALEKVRSFRREVGRFAAEKEAASDMGLVIVPAVVGDGETCHFIVDTGASRVVISPQLADALGLPSAAKEEAETTIAGGTVLKGREVVLPKISVCGAEARDVKAVVLPEVSAGTDGLLGRSFLKRFVVTIDDGAEPKVRLRAR